MSDDQMIFSNPAIPPSVSYSIYQHTLKQRTTLRPLHRHTHYAELLYMTSGTGVYTIDGISYLIHPGDILLYNKGSFHELAPYKNDTTDHYCFGISNLSLKDLPSGHLTRPEDGFVRPAGKNREQFEALASLLYETHRKKPSPLNTSLCGSLLSSLVLLSVNTPADERTKQMHREDFIAGSILNYINMHFTEEVTLDDIGKELNISPYYASHVFKSCYGTSPVQYLIGCRLGEAQNLLISSDHSIEDISAIVGYNSCNHFKTIFRQKVGLSPGKYRSYARQEMLSGRNIQ